MIRLHCPSKCSGPLLKTSLSGELSATAIYEHFPVSPQAISQHLKVLREANLVQMEKRAQKHLYSLNPHTLAQFETWVAQVQQSMY